MHFAAFFAATSFAAFAQTNDSINGNQLEEIYISDTKVGLSKEKSGKIITKITQEELQKKSGQSLATVLSGVVGVEINGNQSVNGKNLGYYVRGAKNQQVLILIDGNPVTDASGISFEYDLRFLSVDQIESIEIMKGAASTLYGTGAASAVINITLKKGLKKAINGTAFLNIGSNETSKDSKYNGQDFNQGFAFNGTINKLNYYAGINSSETNGMSQISANENQVLENDRFSRLNFMSKIGYKASKKVQLDFFGTYDKIFNQYDGTFDNTGFNDTNVNNSLSKQLRFGFSPKYNYKDGELILNSAFSNLERSYNELNTWSNTVDFSVYGARSLNIELLNKYKINSNLFVINGINYQFHDMSSETPFGNIRNEQTKFNNIDPYGALVYTIKGLNLNIGGRLNNHSQYGNQWVYNVNPSYTFGTKNPVKVLASYSTAYVTPSLYQLYSEYGNANLTPENNATAEAGFEALLLDKKLVVNAVAFHREQENSFGFFFDNVTFDSYYINLEGTNKAKGVETEIAYTVNNNFKLSGNYTFTQVDEALLRLIPKHKVNASIDYSLTKRLFLNANYQYVDGRLDAFFDGNSFATVQTILGSYQLVNASAKFELIKNRLNVFGQVTNILNEDFIENIGYSTRGRNFRLGLNLSF